MRSPNHGANFDPQIVFNDVDEDSIYLSTCNKLTNEGMTVDAAYVRVCANDALICVGAGTVPPPQCVTAPVVAQ